MIRCRFRGRRAVRPPSSPPRPCSFSGQVLSERRQRRRAATIAAASGRRSRRAGVRRLSIDEAVAMALEQNVDLQVDRIDPQVQDYSVSVARSSWTPAFFSNVTDPQPDQPADRHLRRRHHGDHRRAPDVAGRHPAGAAVGRRQLHGVLEQRPRDHQQHVQQLQSAAELDGLGSTTRSRCCATSRSTRPGSRCWSARRTARSRTCSCSSRSR